MNDLVRLPHVFEERKNWKKAVAPAGAALLLVALGWGAGAKIDALRGPSPEIVAARAAAENAENALRAEQAQKQEIAALQAHMDGLKGRLEAQAQKARESDAAVAALQKSLAEEKAQSQSLHARLDKMQAQPAKPKEQALAQPPQPAARPIDHAPTASIGKPIAKPLAVKPLAVKPLAVAIEPPKPYRAYVLRDVNDGMAVIEGEEGVEEVGPGDVLAGGARVQRIEKRGGAWVVMTDRGYIAPDGRWEN
jgi:hypothetical protein